VHVPTAPLPPPPPASSSPSASQAPSSSPPPASWLNAAADVAGEEVPPSTGEASGDNDNDDDDDDDDDDDAVALEDAALVDAEVFAGQGVDCDGPRSGGPPLDLPGTVARHKLDALARPYDARAAAVLVPFGVEFVNAHIVWPGARWNRPTRRSRSGEL